eukprot:CAMPEP_0114424536 /NCGR_PEP_ID=MMETSP0103-20121206/6748_1 /TAXON_ID=37642 ORGANISM="Paraphysomonas imperforata, Strain PA2" /NCGR_SAMPLE_ID=MMETSP0103 /ASSEMBLY_ACC=CAM_ASM_000201 /LENGTH=287 /DNA_ID=CAMNT_0001593299 /DNA_START=360 /DNA_END=1223 /DNA_ORIENTATION=+
MTPETNTQRIFTIIMLFVGMIAVFSTINDFATYIINKAEMKALEHFDDDEIYDHRAKYALRIFLSVLCILVCLMVGTVFFIYNEEWDFVQSLYFSVVTTVSVGYGDRELSKQSSRMFLIFYIIISVIVVAGAIGNFGSIKMEMAFEERKLAMLKKEFDMDALMQMDANGDGVDEIEFLTAMLVQMHGLDKDKDIKPWLKRFRELDADGSGRLDMKDLQLFARQQKLALKNKLRRFSNRDLVSFCSDLSDDEDPEGDVEGRQHNGNNGNSGGERGDVEMRMPDHTSSS